MLKVVTVVALAAGLVAPAPAGAAEAVPSRSFNGTWSVELVTESGLCDSRYNYAVSVQEGNVRLVSGSDAATRMSGRVGSDGTVGLSVSNGSASGAVSGRLQARSGGGTWKVSALCSGRWTARRQGAQVAQAE
ncbi:hypothetical protein [Methylobacterium planeticum]|uniref:Heme utilization protein n=1 Tax=Methylobacterium planeticum TaxID=2615211 RepID=A0A6N6MQ41_9HYPH|nr:hypothetical protein [Methylobacterium planeticum]KAB1072138.1 hypothetical protein F6X51_17065 [Methylobacterium planeticum]